MKHVDYKLPQYPELIFSTSIKTGDRQRQSYTVSIQASGPSEARAGWLSDFEKWSTGHGGIPKRRRAQGDCVERGLVFHGSSALVAFIVQWVGLDWARVDACEVEAPVPQPEIAALRGEIQGLTSAIKEIGLRLRVADYRLWAAARGLLGLNLQALDMTNNNWDHLLVHESKPDNSA
ncbi:MAG: hypothetical protein K0S56_4292 [Microvirga sp.]|jgi:hypothetical protein|nr:hypothetical protein [Microvirga sp.]